MGQSECDDLRHLSPIYRFSGPRTGQAALGKALMGGLSCA